MKNNQGTKWTSWHSLQKMLLIKMFVSGTSSGSKWPMPISGHSSINLRQAWKGVEGGSLRNWKSQTLATSRPWDCSEHRRTTRAWVKPRTRALSPARFDVHPDIPPSLGIFDLPQMAWRGICGFSPWASSWGMDSSSSTCNSHRKGARTKLYLFF